MHYKENIFVFITVRGNFNDSKYTHHLNAFRMDLWHKEFTIKILPSSTKKM